jgi:protein-serine/threonine kinase
MDNRSDRLFLNFGNNNDRLAASDRSYPTTPSTFPQPVFPTSSNQQQPVPSNIGMQSSQQSQPYQASGYGSAGYFGQNQFPSSQFSSQQPHSSHGESNYSGLQAGNAQYQPRANTPGATSNDPNTGLAHQFSHQNLGGAARASPYGSRGPSPSQRPRTAGTPGHQTGYGSYLNAPMPAPPTHSPAFEFQSAPDRNPDRYGPNANNNQKKCSQLAADFFKDSVKRARERNQR